MTLMQAEHANTSTILVASSNTSRDVVTAPTKDDACDKKRHPQKWHKKPPGLFGSREAKASLLIAREIPVETVRVT